MGHPANVTLILTNGQSNAKAVAKARITIVSARTQMIHGGWSLEISTEYLNTESEARVTIDYSRAALIDSTGKVYRGQAARTYLRNDGLGGLVEVNEVEHFIDCGPDSTFTNNVVFICK